MRSLLDSVTRLTLRVAAFNAGALAFYEALGYEITMLRLARDLPPED